MKNELQAVAAEGKYAIGQLAGWVSEDRPLAMPGTVDCNVHRLGKMNGAIPKIYGFRMECLDQTRGRTNWEITGQRGIAHLLRAAELGHWIQIGMAGVGPKGSAKGLVMDEAVWLPYEQLDALGVVLDALGAVGVPTGVMLFHEQTDAHFWYGAPRRNKELQEARGDWYQQLFRGAWDYLDHKFPHTHLASKLWGPSTKGEADPRWSYPGPEYVDVVSPSHYGSGVPVDGDKSTGKFPLRQLKNLSICKELGGGLVYGGERGPAQAAKAIVAGGDRVPRFSTHDFAADLGSDFCGGQWWNGCYSPLQWLSTTRSPSELFQSPKAVVL